MYLLWTRRMMLAPALSSAQTLSLIRRVSLNLQVKLTSPTPKTQALDPQLPVRMCRHLLAQAAHFYPGPVTLRKAQR